MNITHKQYQQRVKERMPKTKTLLHCVRAFLVGGLICCIGQLIGDLYKIWFNLEGKELAAVVAMTMVFLGATLTGLGIYDKIGKFAGAGSIVPITGFANSVAAPAMEFRREGYVMGIGAKLFSLAGPVLVYGITASVIAGLISLLLN